MDLSDGGSDDFGGTSNYQTLYTNYKYKGATNYSVTVENRSDYSLKVKVRTSLTTLASKTISPNSTATFSVKGISSTKKFYISFTGSYQNFSGSITGFEW